MGATFGPGALIARRYRLDRLLGRGGMGSVWSAVHTVTGRAVALKLARGELRQRFVREARAATSVRHPNVVTVLDAFELDDDTSVIVMDLLIGETLRECIEREEQLCLPRAASILLPVVSAVGTAHARGIVHRDLKPENVFLARAGDGRETVKVLDFGIAKLSAPIAHTEHAGLVTQAGATIGTPCYMAPEQAAGERDIDHRADVWALGVILYECLSGIRPIDGESSGQVLMRLMSTGITPLERVTLGLPEEVTQLVGRMLAREPGKRPADLRAVADLLRRHTDVRAPEFDAPGSAIADEEPLERFEPALVPEPRRKARPRAWASVAVVAALATVAAWASCKSRDVPRSLNAAFRIPELVRPPPPAAPATSVPPRPVATSTARAPSRRAARSPTAARSPASSEPLMGLAETPPF